MHDCVPCSQHQVHLTGERVALDEDDDDDMEDYYDIDSSDDDMDLEDMPFGYGDEESSDEGDGASVRHPLIGLGFIDLDSARGGGC